MEQLGDKARKCDPYFHWKLQLVGCSCRSCIQTRPDPTKMPSWSSPVVEKIAEALLCDEMSQRDCSPNNHAVWCPQARACSSTCFSNNCTFSPKDPLHCIGAPVHIKNLFIKRERRLMYHSWSTLQKHQGWHAWQFKLMTEVSSAQQLQDPSWLQAQNPNSPAFHSNGITMELSLESLEE